MLLPLILSVAWLAVFKGVLLFFFLLSAALLILVVLLQEPKGGGLAAAFGGAGAETFGVQSGSVNKFTSYVAAAFMVMAILFAAIRPGEDVSVLDTEDPVDAVSPLDAPVDGCGGGESDKDDG